MTSSDRGLTAAPAYPAAHGLRRDRVVTITAAAGTGIGARVRPAHLDEAGLGTQRILGNAREHRQHLADVLLPSLPDD